MKYYGSCLCKAVTYELDDPLRPSIACHCTQCRKTSGHYWSATQVPNEQFHLINDKGLKWHNSSNTARRGFCKKCGSSLFWQQHNQATISVASGTLNETGDLKTAKHIFVADKGTYYHIEETLEQVAQY